MAKEKTAGNEILKIARKHFDFKSLRPGQQEAVEALVAGRDTLVVQPTGAGKSAIYQIAGLMLDGATVVISPLIALQKDQVDSINEQDAAEAVLVNSQQRATDHQRTLEQIEQGKAEYIFLAPEQLRKQETLERLDRAHVSLFVVDEAHCITEWGHDFRPDYMQIAPAIERLGKPVILAMTATATPEVRSEIVERLGMRDPQILVHGFDRPNIHLRVDHFETEKDKREALVRRVAWAEKPGIVYVGTRSNAEQLMASLSEEGVDALFYHAGLKASERESIQDRFMSGEAEVIVATNAFGMGVDKADIRFVYHYDIPGSLDAYYQEIGRAGRDGENAEAILFYRTANVGTQKFRTGQGKLDEGKIREVAEAIAKEEGPVEPDEVTQDLELSDRKISSALHRLQDAGALEVLPTGEVQLVDGTDIDDAAQRAAEGQQKFQEQRREKLLRMQEYADSSECRRSLILRYFGDSYEAPCSNCDNCEGGEASGKFAGGSRREVA